MANGAEANAIKHTVARAWIEGKLVPSALTGESDKSRDTREGGVEDT